MFHKGIVCGGNWIIDHVKMIDSWPAEGHLVTILEQESATGGPACNVLTGLAKYNQGISLIGIGLVGDDPDGQLLIAHSKQHHINIDRVNIVKDQPTSYTDVMTIKSTGRRTFFHNRGASKLLTDEHFDFTGLTAKIFHLGYLLLLDGLDQLDEEYGTKSAKVLHKAQKAGIKTSLDVVSEMSDRFQKLITPALKYVDYLIINELEAGLTTGNKIRVGEDLDLVALRKSAQELLKHGVKELVVIHFPEGGYALTKSGEEKRYGSLILPDGFIKGTVGAGDAFCTGILFGLHEGWDLENSLRLAVSSAAACISDPTCTDGMLSLEDTLELSKKYPPRKL